MSSIDNPASWRQMFSVFGRIGLLSFGGPAGQIALMHREIVDEQKWLDEERFLHALNFCMLLPGPEAMQLATYSGWLLRGVAGGLLAGLLFVLPGFAIMVALSAAYFHFGDLPVATGVLLGMKAAVLAIVVQALMRVAKRALKTPLAYGLAIAAFVAIALFKLPFPLIILGAGLIGIATGIFGQRDPPASQEISSAGIFPKSRNDSSLLALVIWGSVWLLPLVALLYLLPGLFAEMAVFFSQAAIVTFGGAYAVLAYVGQLAVGVHGWLLPGDMLAGLGLAETTPGPLILVLVFVGFLGGARGMTEMPGWGGLSGAVVALFFTFAPCFLWIFVGAPHIERVRNVKWLSKGLSAITAAVVGVIANLAVWFALHVLFGEIAEVRLGPVHLPVPEITTLNPAAMLIALFAGVALIRFGIGLLKVLGAAVVFGLLVTMSGFG